MDCRCTNWSALRARSGPFEGPARVKPPALPGDIYLLPERPAIPANCPVTLPVLVRLTAPTIPQAARKPLNLCLVIDHSGSMAGEKLERTLASAKYVVRRLAPTDLLSVVQFDEQVRVVFSPRPVLNPGHLCALLDRIRDGGSTNLSGGWLRGADCVREHLSPAFINRVLLLTDGQANHGVTEPDVLIQHAAELTEEGITTTTLGYGEDFHEELLTALADAGRGNAYHVATADQAPGIFAQELEGLLAVAAQNVRVTLVPTGAGCTVELLTGQECHATSHGLEVALGDLVSEETRSLLCKLRLPALTAGEAVVASVTVAYDAVCERIQSTRKAQDLLLGIVPPAQAAALPPDASVMRELVVLRAARVLTQAIAQADGGDVPGALHHLRTFLALPEVAKSSDPEIRAARHRIKDCILALEDRGFDRSNRKQMYYGSRDMSQGKSRRSRTT